MDSAGVVVSVQIAPERDAPMRSVPHAEADRLGIVGDRYRKRRYRRAGAVTLVAEEDVARVAGILGVDLVPLQTRRNVVTRGVDLGTLVGRRFRIGSVVLLGVERCDPCGRLERRTHAGVRAHLHGGLRCDVVEAGVFRVGESILPEDGPPDDRLALSSGV